MPGTTFHFVVSDSEDRCLSEEVDVAILHGEDRFPLHDSIRLFDEVVFPVCSPAYLKGVPEVRQPRDLLNVRLIDLEDDNWTWINWRIWLTDHGVGLPATHRALTIGNYPLVLEAARRGAGMALAWQNLIEDDLASGTARQAACRAGPHPIRLPARLAEVAPADAAGRILHQLGS